MAQEAEDPFTGADFEQAWSAIPGQAVHPVRVAMIEALWRTGEPLSAVGFVDVLDGFVSMWEAAYHLRVLAALNVAEPDPDETSSAGSGQSPFAARYRLTSPE